MAEVKVEVSRDGENYLDFNEYVGFMTEKGKGAWAEIDLRSVKARFFRLSPKFQGWGHLWGEVEFWEITVNVNSDCSSTWLISIPKIL